MNDISDILRELFDRYGNTDELGDEFRMMLQDERLMSEYREWCRECGYSTRTGFRDYVDELVESQDSIWDNYREYGHDI